ncbi:MAG: hypothetical protein V2J89_00655 [Halieaceae bacterium]|jgi:hypothetical protein|nr:hypothetical protein [Halieaceae bacterium]
MIQHRIDPEQGCIFIEVRGTPQLQDCIAASQLVVRDPLYNIDYHRMIDFSQANLSHATGDDVSRFVDFAKTSIPMARTARISIVAPDPERAGILRTFAKLINRGSFRIFYEPMEARDWIENGQATDPFDKVLGGVA